MIIIIILIVGLSGIVAQVLLLRELLVSFWGNELTIGIILANWIATEAIGAFLLGSLTRRIKNKFNALIMLQILFTLSLPVSIYLARTFKALASMPFGEAVGLATIFTASLIIILPVAFAHGASFSLLCEIYASVGKVYSWEMLGTILGGVVLTYIFLPFFNSFQIIYFITLANLVICLYFLKQMSKFLKYALLGAMAILIIFSLKGGIGYLQHNSLNQQFRSNEVLDSQNSLYGNIAVVKRHRQYTFYYNGLPVIVTPYPDINFMEDFGNLALLFHQDPKEVLLLGSGAGGLIQEILKHPITCLDYAELDPLLIRMLKKYPTRLTAAELSDKRVHIAQSDSRFFLRQSQKKYDVILIGLSNPADLSANRTFTQEFFALAKNRLNPDGILSFWLSGSLTYLSKELQNLNLSVLNAAKEVFSYTRIIPGDYNIFLVSNSATIQDISPEVISARIAKRNVQAHLLTRGYLDYRLNARQLDWFLRSSLKATKSINHDLRPVAVYQSLLYWNKKFSVLLYKVLEAAQGLNLKNIFILIFLVTSIWLYYLRRRQNKNIAVSYSIATTGFFSMLSNLMLIFAYQVFCGYLYQRIGLLTSIFMAGIALGSIWITARLGRLKNPFDLFLKLELLIILFVGLLFLVINHFFASGQYIWYAFILLFFFCGLLTGLEFPLANKICLAGVHTVGKTVGSLYALDLLGGWLAGMVGGVILLPVLGFGGNCAVMAALKVSSFFGVSFSGLTSRSKLNKNRSDPVFKNLLTSAVS